jgi:hypothetical protein
MIYLYVWQYLTSSWLLPVSVALLGLTIGGVMFYSSSAKIFIYKKLKLFITYYISFLLFIRSFFLRERPYIIPLLIGIITSNTFYQFLPFITTMATPIYTFSIIGIYLIGVDSICSVLSKLILENVSGIWDEVYAFLTSSSHSTFINYYKSAGLMGLIIGKTPMTATGRAALGAAIIGGTFLITNTLILGHQQAAEGQRNRDFQAAESQRHRDFQNRQYQKDQEWKSYNASWNPFKKPPAE